MFKKITLISCVLIALSGCQTAPTSLYAWGNYESALFASFHEPEAREAELAKYLAFMQLAPKYEQKFGPGLYAEAGTFMLQQGNIEQAILFYELEANAWPASLPLMHTLVLNLKARHNIKPTTNNQGESKDE